MPADKRAGVGTSKPGPVTLRATITVMTTLAVVATLAACSGAIDARATRHQVLLVPPLQAGWSGWCFATSTEGGCAAGYTQPPIAAETWSATGPPSVANGYALTAGDVAAISVGGRRRVTTMAAPGLPAGLRVAQIELTAFNPEREPFPRFIPLDASHRAMAQSPLRTPLHNGALEIEDPVQTVNRGREVHAAPCSLAARHLAGLVVGSGSVIRDAHAFTGLIGLGFTVCERMAFDLRGWPLVGVILINASHPGAYPRDLPAMTLTGTGSTTVRAPGPEGELAAKRIAGGWLVVSGANSTQRLALLDHLIGTVAPGI